MKDNEFLSADEVRDLADGTPVTVTWSGGNGPHNYKIKRFKWSTDAHVDNCYNDRLTFVGKELYHTRVSLL